MSRKALKGVTNRDSKELFFPWNECGIFELLWSFGITERRGKHLGISFNFHFQKALETMVLVRRDWEGAFG